jgi:hypothetical protein
VATGPTSSHGIFYFLKNKQDITRPAGLDCVSQADLFSKIFLSVMLATELVVGSRDEEIENSANGSNRVFAAFVAGLSGRF